MYSFSDFFLSPLLRAPTIGSMLMCFTIALMGVLVFVRKKSLVGETLSHAAYPGLVASGAFLASFSSSFQEKYFFFLLLGAFLSSMIALFFIYGMQKRFRVKNDSALCFVLSSFFGIGVLLASGLQGTQPMWHRQIQTFLYGQVATMADSYIWIYGGFAAFTVVVLSIFYRSLQLFYFDPLFAKTIGFSQILWEVAFFVFLSIAAPIAMKSVGIVLFSGMLIAPALGARQLSHKMSAILAISGLIGALSGFFGNYFSTQLSTSSFIFPTGPMIVLFGSFFSLSCLLFAPKRGWVFQVFRKKSLRKECFRKNLMALLSVGKTDLEVSLCLRKSLFFTRRILHKEIARGSIKREGSFYFSLERGVL